jgi:hypothetical protein
MVTVYVETEVLFKGSAINNPQRLIQWLSSSRSKPGLFSALGHAIWSQPLDYMNM